jgi:phenylacetyl-CoA:acceptor oxidoreductase 26-kDa subunit
VGAINKVRGTEPELQPFWDWRAAGNFIFGGAGAGLLTFAALLAPFPSPASAVGAIAGAGLIGAGLGCVSLELGRRMRALYVFLRPHTSWMSREAIVATLLFPLVAAQVALGNAFLALIGAALAMLFLYCQARILKAARGVPAFRAASIVPLIFITGLTEGGALLILLGVAVGSLSAWIIAATGVLLAVRLAVWRAYRSNLSAPGGAPKAAVRALAAIDAPVTGAGHILALGLLAIALIAPPAAAPLASIGAILALAAGWYLKFTLVTRASYTDGFAIPHSPARTHGYSRAGAKPGWT